MKPYLTTLFCTIPYHNYTVQFCFMQYHTILNHVSNSVAVLYNSIEYLKSILDGNYRVEMYIHLVDLTRNSCEKCNFRSLKNSIPYHLTISYCTPSYTIPHMIPYTIPYYIIPKSVVLPGSTSPN